jgi:hypothetical protein
MPCFHNGSRRILPIASRYAAVVQSAIVRSREGNLIEDRRRGQPSRLAFAIRSNHRPDPGLMHLAVKCPVVEALAS